jgi:hypothetical protein
MNTNEEEETVEWEIAFKMEEHSVPQSKSQRSSTQQRDITHAIARAIASIPTQFEVLTIADYHIVRAGKDQPEADALHTRWGGDKKPR